MEIMIVLLPLALVMGAVFIGAFVWAVRRGQYDDLETAKYRMLLEETSSGDKKK